MTLVRAPAARRRATDTTAEAAWLVAEGHTHGLAQVRLLKLLWLSELRYYEAGGSRLTPANWWKWEHGPYSKDVINTVKTAARSFSLQRDPDLVGATGLLIKAKPTRPGNALNGPGDATIREVMNLYSSYSTSELLDEVYSDPFFEATAYGADFDFSQLRAFRKPVPPEGARRLLELESRSVPSVDALFG
jgi:uncharacterized phage-associated protein